MPVRDIVKILKQQGLSQSEIGRKVGVSRERVRQIIRDKSATKKHKDMDILLSTGDAARLLNVHINTIRRWSRIGLLITYRLGPRGDRRFMLEDIQKILRLKT